jgi:hypothetical protein
MGWGGGGGGCGWVGYALARGVPLALLTGAYPDSKEL